VPSAGSPPRFITLSFSKSLIPEPGALEGSFLADFGRRFVVTELLELFSERLPIESIRLALGCLFCDQSRSQGNWIGVECETKQRALCRQPPARCRVRAGEAIRRSGVRSSVNQKRMSAGMAFSLR
jgi:hypothetical protein